MLLSDLALYVLLLVSLTLAPGPLMAVMVSRAVGNDVRGAFSFGIGIALGDVIVIALICAGLGLWLQTMPEVFAVGKAVGLLYFLWVAKGIWQGSINLHERPISRRNGSILAVVGGVGTCMASPQTLILYLALLPGLVEVEQVGAGTFLALSAVTFAALALTFAVIVGLAGGLRKLLGQPEKLTLINRGLAVVVGGSGVWMMVA